MASDMKSPFAISLCFTAGEGRDDLDGAIDMWITDVKEFAFWFAWQNGSNLKFWIEYYNWYKMLNNKWILTTYKMHDFKNVL